jgi:F-type H+-transporting ATPase subunit delta
LIRSKVSKRYAKALFSLGQEDGQFEQYGRNLMEFAEFCRQNAEFGEVIANPIFPLGERKKLLQKVLERSTFSGVAMNFFNFLLDKDRMGAIAAISDYYSMLTDEMANILRAEISTARPMKKDTLQKIEKSLEQLTSKKIRSTVKEDSSLIGGVAVKIGDLVLDGSLRAQIKGLKESLKRDEMN